jgi:hypothetical protein
MARDIVAGESPTFFANSYIVIFFIVFLNQGWHNETGFIINIQNNFKSQVKNSEYSALFFWGHAYSVLTFILYIQRIQTSFGHRSR